MVAKTTVPWSARGRSDAAFLAKAAPGDACQALAQLVRGGIAQVADLVQWS